MEMKNFQHYIQLLDISRMLDTSNHPTKKCNTQIIHELNFINKGGMNAPKSITISSLTAILS